jgi:hypothetical protein
VIICNVDVQLILGNMRGQLKSGNAFNVTNWKRKSQESVGALARNIMRRSMRFILRNENQSDSHLC